MNIIVNGGTLPQKGIDAYVNYSKEKYSDKVIKTLTINVDGEYVNLETEFENDVV